MAGTKKQKMDISKAIVLAVYSMDPPGRFLKQCSVTCQWNELSRREATDRATQAMAYAIRGKEISKRKKEERLRRSSRISQHQQSKDSDNDGMPDWWEIDFGLDPFDAADAALDSDMDGYDKNRNGLIEEEEYFTNLMEFEMRLVVGNSTDPTSIDSDNDGMPDGWEIYYNLNPISDIDANEDNDNDGYDANGDKTIDSDEQLTNLEEYLAGTSPWVNDTDADWMTDGWEVYWSDWLFDCLDNNGCKSAHSHLTVNSSFNPIDNSDAWQDPDSDGWDENYDNELF